MSLYKMAAFIANINTQAAPELSREDVINKIIAKTELENPHETFIPLTGICKDTVKFERSYTIKGPVNKKDRSMVRYEYHVNVNIPLTSPIIQSKNEFIKSISIAEVRDIVNIKYIETVVGPMR